MNDKIALSHGLPAALGMRYMLMEFKNEYEYLIHLIKCAIHDTTPCEMPKQLSFYTVYKYAQQHDIANLAFYSVKKLEKKPNKDLYSKWEKKCLLAIQRDLYQRQVRDQVVTALGSHGIRTMELQGTRFKLFYPKPEYRTMSDIDFIIELENLRKAYDILISLGYDCRIYDDRDINGKGPHNLTIEIHTSFFAHNNELYTCIKDYEHPFAHASLKDENLSYEADDNTFYLYSLFHFLKHFNGKGCGIRRILDMYYLNQLFSDKIDSEYIDKTLKDIGYYKTIQDVFAVADIWFGTSEGDGALSKLENFICSSGLHGTVLNESKNMMRRARKGNSRFPRLNYLKTFIFPDKQHFKNYPFIKKHPKTPLIICYIYGWLTVFRDPKRRARALSLVKYAFKKN